MSLVGDGNATMTLVLRGASPLPAEVLALPLRIESSRFERTVTVADLVPGYQVVLAMAGVPVQVRLMVPRSSHFLSDVGLLVMAKTSASVSSILAQGRRSDAGPVVSLAPPTCTLSAASGTCSGVSYTIAPFTIGVIGTFQSGPDTGPSSPITITFGSFVNSVTITIQDPTFSGNTMTAYNGSVAIGTASFAFSGVPGVNTPDTKTLSGTITKVVLTPAPGDYVAYGGGFEPAPSQVSVACTPSTLTRGQPVTCTTTVTPTQPFTIIRRAATGFLLYVEDTTRSSYLAGQSDPWQGPAIASSSVEVEVEITAQSGGTVRIRNTPASFAVTPRSWPVWALQYPASLASLEYVIQAGIFDPYPITGLFGGFLLSPVLDSNVVTLQPAVTGPNQGYTILQNPLILKYRVYIHPALDPVEAANQLPLFPQPLAWYNDQNNLGSGTCTAGDIAVLKTNVIRHEGGTGSSQSHFGIANQQFPILRPDQLLERTYAKGNDQAFRQVVFAQIKQFGALGGAYKTAQKAFDSADSASVYPSNCVLDNTLRDGK